MLRRLGRFVALICVFGSATAAAEDSARIWTYKYVLATSTAEPQIAPVLEHLAKDAPQRDVSMVDLAAELLVSNVDDPLYDVEIKLALLDFLEQYGSPRYRTVMTRIAKAREFRSVKKDEHKESHKTALRSIKKWDAQVEQYLPGAINLVALRQQYVDAALAAHPSAQLAQRLVKELNANSSIEDMFAIGGKPQHVVSGETRTGDRLLIYIRIQRLAFYYRGVGRVVFGYRKGKGWLFQAVVADALAFESLMPYRARAVELGLPGDDELALTQLLSRQTAAMKFTLERLNRSGKISPEFLDTTAEVLVKEHASASDPVAIDVYAWMCRLLTTYGGERYAQVLASVAAATADEKLRRFASMEIEKPPAGANPAPYVAGTVSLTAQRARYPSLYPDHTFTSGQL